MFIFLIPSSLYAATEDSSEETETSQSKEAAENEKNETTEIDEDSNGNSQNDETETIGDSESDNQKSDEADKNTDTSEEVSPTDEVNETPTNNAEKAGNELEKEIEQNNITADEQKNINNQQVNEEQNVKTQKLESKENKSQEETPDFPYKNGDRSEVLIEVKRMLNSVGFDRIKVTDYFGDWTETRVRQFQANYGLTETGEVDRKTFDKLNDVFKSPFQLGERHSKTIDLKKMLNTIGYGYITVTDLYGSFTESQVKKFQADHGLKNNGIADEVTRKKVQEIYDSIIKPGDNDPRLIDVKEKLNSMGFNNIAVTDYFGNWTETRVKQFQDFAGLDQTGLLDQETISALDDLASNGYTTSDSFWTISNIKEKLNAIEFDGIAETNNYGNWTKTRIKQFQENYNLNPSGNANKETLDKLNEVYYSPFQQGKRHNKTIELKEMLNTIGYGYITVSDLFGSFTETQVKKFQSDYGLKNNGIADEITRQKVKELYNTTLKPGDRDSKLIDVKQKLNSMGFDNIAISDYYGNWTETRVKQFQDFANLRVTGILDARTINALDQLALDGYSTGNRSWTISNFKSKLNAAGFDGIATTNYFGNWTETRVRQFQDYYGLSVTGKANQPTLDKLNEVVSSPFQLGERHSETVDIKQKLNEIGFGYITVTTLYGNFTQNQVEAFQNYYGLRVNGIADEVTLSKIDEIYNHPLQHGKRNNQLIDIKEKLNALGYGHITVTNYFGNFSKQKVEEFQSDYNLRVNGIVDGPTLSKINQIYNSSFKIGDRHEDIIDLKEALNALGYGNITVTTYYGNFTEKRVKDFQRDHNLKVTGVANPKTLKAIDEQVIRLFIDPGHGGHDPGGTGYGLEEKDIVLDISLRLANYLRNNYYGILVDLSRESDVFVELEKRAEKANEIGSDYFLSVHTNAWLGKGRGFETYIHDSDYTNEDVKRQNDIHDYLMNRFGSTILDRGKKDANFSVLRNSDMPSILIEYLFIDNRTENNLLRQASYRQKLAQWTGQALAESFNLTKR